MHWIDACIFALYMLAMLAVGYYFLKKNKSTDDYYVGGRSMSAWHIGLSVVATDVGGGFSIGLGGLGFTMGMSGSWMLFTGLIGAWLSAAILIPRLFKIEEFKRLFTFPQIFNSFFNKNVALVAGIISAIGYLGFTSSQILAGAKLAGGVFPEFNQDTALIIMGVIAVVYTVMGGLKAVIYTDTIQWIILLCGLVFIGIPMAYFAVGGWDSIQGTLSSQFLTLTNLHWYDIVKWCLTIIPIWFVAMTLYQRIYASKTEKDARRAWFFAGILEWPIMAFMGVTLGLLARVAFQQGMFSEFAEAATLSGFDAETGMPMLLREILPVGLLGLMMSAYFSAILSTADSCLMASSGNIVSDIIARVTKLNYKKELRISQLVTLLLGAAAVLIALSFDQVLGLMLKSYAFLISGLLVPVLGALFWKKSTSQGAITAMILGGSTTITMQSIITNFQDNVSHENLNSFGKLFYHLDANAYGLFIALISFIIVSLLTSSHKTKLETHGR